MTLDSNTFVFIKLAVFALASLPLVIDNLRTGRITNWNNAVLFIAGGGMLALGPALGLSTFRLPSLTPWLLVVLAAPVLFARGMIGGGAAKFLMALLPWFTPIDYVCVVAAGFVGAGIIAMARRRKEMQIAVPVVLLGLVALAGRAATAPRVR